MTTWGQQMFPVDYSSMVEGEQQQLVSVVVAREVSAEIVRDLVVVQVEVVVAVSVPW